jgi:hypothetical protein
MEVRGQPTALFLWKEPPVLIVKVVGWASEPIRTLLRAENFMALDGNITQLPRVSASSLAVIDPFCLLYKNR